METAGRQAVAPRALRAGKSTSPRCARRSVVYFAFLLAFLSIVLTAPRGVWAQHWAGSVNPGSPSQSGNAKSQLALLQEPEFSTMPADNSWLIETESCESWTAAEVSSPTVSVARLAVPKNARSEFRKACGELKDNRFQAAEDHARRAVEMYPDYAAAWVVLGQALKGGHKDGEAVQACRRAIKADPTYAPPYICLAQFAESSNDWDNVYSFSDHARSLDPGGDPYAYYYAAAADLHLNRYEQAELDARFAEKLDVRNQIPELHLLLANVYQAKGDKADQAQELQKFLQLSPHDSQWQSARTTLTAIETDPAK